MMKIRIGLLVAVVLAFLLMIVAMAADARNPRGGALAPSGAACGMQLGSTPAILCTQFFVPYNNSAREGQLNGDVWGASRTTGNVNTGQNQLGMWNATVLNKCDGTNPTVVVPNDIIVCNGQLREASNDNNTLSFEDGTVTSLAVYPKQPFDFTSRTGTISFDVSNDTSGSHGSWPEIWMSNLPVPDPFSHFATWFAFPQHGWGLRLDANCDPGSACQCTNSNNIGLYRWTVGTFIAIRNYVYEDTDGFGTPTGMTVTPTDCVIMSSGPGSMNHVEIRMSQNQMDVYATDAGVVATPSTLRHIGVVTGMNLSATKGLVWLEDAHYNADKGDPTMPTQRQHTYAWANLAFDGPFTQRDFTYDAPDDGTVVSNGAKNLGKFSNSNATSSWSIAGLPANRLAGAAVVLYSFTNTGSAVPTTLNVTVNGHAHSIAWPYPDTDLTSWRTYGFVVNLSDLVTGTNTVLIGSDQPQVTANVDIALANVTNGQPILPGSNDAYPN